MTDLKKLREQDPNELMKKRDQEFFLLYDKHSSALYNKICMWVNDKPLAQDILLQSFIQIHRQFFNEAIDDEDVFNWMLNITRSTCYAAIEKKDSVKPVRSLLG